MDSASHQAAFYGKTGFGLRLSSLDNIFRVMTISSQFPLRTSKDRTQTCTDFCSTHFFLLFVFPLCLRLVIKLIPHR